jgi:hypothetical protein
MNENDHIYDKFMDEASEEYYCPINAVADYHILSEWELDSCVEVCTANRFSGNINVVDCSIS